jgi:Holliday junction resolvase RusA-like endonuclease
MNVRGRGRVKSKQYRQWVEDNEHAAGALNTPTKFPVKVCLKVCGKVNVRRDLDNIIKPCIDLLVSTGVLPGDSVKYVTGGQWSYQPGDCEPFVLVWWEEVE